MGCEWPFTSVGMLSDRTARFRWVVCQLDALRRCRTPAALETALTRLPKTLNETYDRILGAINEDDRRDALSLLKWLAFSVRTLSTDEAVEVIATDPDTREGPLFDRRRRLRDPGDILTICSSLVTITFPETSNAEDGDSEDNSNESNVEGSIDHHDDRVPFIIRGKIRLAHFSVREYLISEHLRMRTAAFSCYYFNEKIAHVFIAKTCLAYLLQFDQDNGVHSDTARSYPLFPYAADNWIYHAGWDPAGDWDDLHELIMTFLEPTSAVYRRWTWLYRQGNPLDQSEMDPLYVAAETGLERACRHLLQNGSDVNVLGGIYGTPLQVAASSGHNAIVHLLLEMDADVNAQGGRYGSALHAAASGGHDTIVRVLLEKGAEVNAQGGWYGSALQAAASGGHNTTVWLLLEKGAEVNAQGGRFGSALQAAACWGHDTTVRLLLEKGADVNAQGGMYGGALQAAVGNGHDAIASLLEVTTTAVPNENQHATLPEFKSVRRRHALCVLILLSSYPRDQDG
jgi:Ankyrin repeats (3 copies)